MLLLYLSICVCMFYLFVCYRSVRPTALEARVCVLIAQWVQVSHAAAR
jgi:hypothetical protein